MERTLLKQAAPLVVVAAALAAFTPGVAGEQRQGFAGVEVGRSGDIPKSDRDRAIEDLARQQSDPEHVAVLIHGFDTPTWSSTEQFNEVGPIVRSEFEKLGRRASVLGIQWDSNVGPQRKWVPAAFGHYLFSFIGMPKLIRDPYISRVPIARTVGRIGVRQIIFDVQDRWPNARVHVFAHSMGAEAAAHAINPEFTPPKPEDEEQIYLPARPLKLDVVTLAGADLDFDAGAKSKPVNPSAAPRMLWLTLPKIGAKKDKVLSLRKKARSKAALGNAVPRFRQDQYDALIGSRRLVFDTVDIPSNHALLDYFKAGRIARVALAAEGIRDPEHNPSPLLKKMEEVLAAPAETNAISPFLLGDETSPKVYALWRLEHILCGGSGHMSDGYAEKVLTKTLRNPEWLDEERATTTCGVVKQGFWPPSDVVAAARQRKARKGKKQPKVDQALGNRSFFSLPIVNLADSRQR